MPDGDASSEGGDSGPICKPCGSVDASSEGGEDHVVMGVVAMPPDGGDGGESGDANDESMGLVDASGGLDSALGLVVNPEAGSD